MAMTGTVISRAPSIAARTAQALFDVALDVLDHDDRVIDDEADRQHQCEQRQ